MHLHNTTYRDSQASYEWSSLGTESRTSVLALHSAWISPAKKPENKEYTRLCKVLKLQLLVYCFWYLSYFILSLITCSNPWCIKSVQYLLAIPRLCFLVPSLPYLQSTQWFHSTRLSPTLKNKAWRNKKSKLLEWAIGTHTENFLLGLQFYFSTYFRESFDPNRRQWIKKSSCNL